MYILLFFWSKDWIYQFFYSKKFISPWENLLVWRKHCNRISSILFTTFNTWYLKARDTKTSVNTWCFEQKINNICTSTSYTSINWMLKYTKHVRSIFADTYKNFSTTSEMKMWFSDWHTTGYWNLQNGWCKKEANFQNVKILNEWSFDFEIFYFLFKSRNLPKTNRPTKFIAE